MSSTQKAAALALVVAVASAALAITALLKAPRATHGAPPAASSDGRVDELEVRLADLERRMRELGSIGAVPLAEGSPVGERTAADVAARLANLEAKLAVGAERAAAAPAEAEAAEALEQERAIARGRPKRGTPEHLAWARERVLDPNLAPMERSQALGEIQKHGAEAFAEDIVHAMVDLGQAAPDPKVRENVWRQFDGAKHPVLTAALVQALSADSDADVREEAAEALDNLRDQPSVRAALERASQSDADERVRWEALRALRKP
jgi:hypothetical protein